MLLLFSSISQIQIVLSREQDDKYFPEGEKETIDRINSYLCNKMTITNYNNKEQNSFKNLSNTPNRKKKLIFKRVNSENILPIKMIKLGDLNELLEWLI